MDFAVVQTEFSSPERAKPLLRPLTERLVDGAVLLIAATMGDEEAKQGSSSFTFHFACRRHGLDDGRCYWVAKEGEQIVGIGGLHHYAWGPPNAVWLGWFAVCPERQGQGLGSCLLDFVIEKARMLGYTKLYVETYSIDIFAQARAFYRAHGFREAGGIASYLPDGGDMVVFYRDLSQ